MIRCPNCDADYLSSENSCPHCSFSPQRVDGFLAWAPDLTREGGGFREEYFEPLSQHEDQNFWFRARNSLLIWAIRKYFQDFDSLLEIGCGTGYVLSGISAAFPSRRLVGGEIFTKGLGFAATRTPSATFVQMDARCAPYTNEFDIAAAFDVIEHIEDDKSVLENLYRAIKPGGGLLLTVPQHQWLWSSADEYACHFRRYSAGDLHDKLRAAGFEIVRSTSFVSLLLPAMLISRRRSMGKKAFDPLDEFRIGPLLNLAFEKILTMERWLIRIGLNLPLGGSRFVIARKIGNKHDSI
ncbi:methyltransferase domain-containing protein [Pseudomonas sp. BN515]|uniref:methyltransferase domain-containing protein n=1 Tax=Pseudomonas sp. BN515 TaxID=2567892 RepID=UPI002453A6C2|nr:methyltransferase domain-containing protein [Pseudomonas sp. BN515]MDH4872494.1 methyltransferase domain-containing protein [Pseudomonas sp. BN515]